MWHPFRRHAKQQPGPQVTVTVTDNGPLTVGVGTGGLAACGNVQVRMAGQTGSTVRNSGAAIASGSGSVAVTGIVRGSISTHVSDGQASMTVGGQRYFGNTVLVEAGSTVSVRGASSVNLTAEAARAGVSVERV